MYQNVQLENPNKNQNIISPIRPHYNDLMIKNSPIKKNIKLYNTNNNPPNENKFSKPYLRNDVSNNNEKVYQRLLSPLRIISPNRKLAAENNYDNIVNLNVEINIKDKNIDNNKSSKDMKRITSARNFPLNKEFNGTIYTFNNEFKPNERD